MNTPVCKCNTKTNHHTQLYAFSRIASQFCLYFLVKFCPHDLFVNTRADLGQCPKVHDEEAKRLYVEARPSVRKRHFEDEFMRFSNHMLSEVDRKIAKGKQRLQLMNKGEPAPVYVSKYQDQLNNLSARIKKLIGEAEEAGNRGDVDQAQGLMTLCDQLKDEKDALVRQHEADGGSDTSSSTTARPSEAGKSATIIGEKPAAGASSPATNDAGPLVPPPSSLAPADANERSTGGGERSERRGRRGDRGDGTWQEFTSTEKQMEVCEVCGAFLIVGDAQQRLEDHLTGKQHMGYSRLRRAVDEMYEKRRQEREEEDRLRDAERKHKFDGNGGGGVRENKFSRRR